MKLLLLLHLFLSVRLPITIQYQYQIVPDRTVENRVTGGRSIMHIPIDMTVTVRADSLFMDEAGYEVTQVQMIVNGDMIVRCKDDMVFYFYRSERLLYVLKLGYEWVYYSETEVKEW